MEATDRCVVCDNLFTTETPCCCDCGTHTCDDLCNPSHPEGVELHEDGVCVICCKTNHPTSRKFDGMNAGGGTFERGE